MRNINGILPGPFHNKLFILLIMLVIVSGCKDNPEVITNENETDIPVTVNQDNNVMNEGKQTNTPKEDSNKEGEADSNINASDFFGVWEFTKILPGYISGLTQEEAEGYIGKQVTYMPLYCEYEGQVLHQPHYKYEQLPTSDFIEGYKLSNQDWNIKEDYITRVEVYQDETQMEPWQEYVSSFFIIDSHLIISIEGDFFQMDRITGSNLNRTIINPATLEVGQQIGELTVSKLDISGTDADLQINDITFSGELTLTGSYEWEDTGDGFGYIITLDEEMLERIPLFEDFDDERSIVLSNTEEAKKMLSSSSGKATFVLTNYSIGYRQIMIKADLVEVK
ncbi:hypothetical protein [Paenibacillus sp. DYY-L-2]|uniref:hypothetical protein n=1 Tax=Paenibacillus sp. DYY-L-2 TaxID=3447013 RepID=UPI003F505974